MNSIYVTVNGYMFMFTVLSNRETKFVFASLDKLALQKGSVQQCFLKVLLPVIVVSFIYQSYIVCNAVRQKKKQAVFTKRINTKTTNVS